MDQQGLAIGEGDVVLFHTGWTDAKLNADPSNGFRRFPASTTMRRAFSPASSPGGRRRYLGFGAVPPKPGDKVFMTTLFCSRKTVFTYWRP